MIRVLVLCVVTQIFAFSAPARAEDSGSCASRLASKTIQFAKDEHGLALAGWGGNITGEIRRVNLEFCCYERIDVQQARYIFVQVAESLRAQLNSDKTARVFLHEYPVGLDCLAISIGCVSQSHEEIDDGYVAYFSLINGVLRFKGYSSRTDRFYLLHEEPYAIALEQVTASRYSKKSKT